MTRAAILILPIENSGCGQIAAATIGSIDAAVFVSFRPAIDR